MADYTVISDIAKGIAAAAAVALRASTLGEPLNKMLVHGPVYDDCCNLVAVSIAAADPTTAQIWPATLDTIPENCFEVEYLPTIILSLRRPCQPVLGQSPNSPFPVPSRITSAGEALMVDYMILTCEMPKLVQEITTARHLPPGMEPHPGYQYAVIPGAITPHLIGDCGGWNMQFRLQVDCCRDDVQDEIRG